VLGGRVEVVATEVVDCAGAVVTGAVVSGGADDSTATGAPPAAVVAVGSSPPSPSPPPNSMNAPAAARPSRTPAPMIATGSRERVPAGSGWS
jgi:hypothetical protein